MEGRIDGGKAKGALLISVLVVVLLGGCTTPGDDAPTPALAGDGMVFSAHGNEIAATDATLALQKMGLSDPYHGVEPTGDVKEFDLYVHDFGVANPYEDREVWMIALSEDPEEPGSVPGPEIRVTQGDTVRVTLHTPHSDFPGHTLHWHGVDVPWEMDGVPFVTQPIAPPGEAATQTYEFVARQPGTYWYHCVTSFPVDIDLGLFGAFIVEPRDPEVDLPFDDEATLMFHETDSQLFAAAGWALNENKDPDPGDLSGNPFDVLDSGVRQARSTVDVAGQIVSRETGMSVIAEAPRDYYPESSPRYKPEYDLFMINGKSFPDTEPIYIEQGETLRLRLINAGQLHKSIHLHGHHVLVTHVDGYPLPQPHWEDTIALAPGERKDVYVQGTNPGIWGLHDHAGSSGMGSTSTNDHAFPGGMMTKLVYEDFEHPDVLPQAEDATAGDFAVYAPSHRAGGR